MVISQEVRANKIAENVCRISGHRIATLFVKKPNPEPQKAEELIHHKFVEEHTELCVACGLTLAEIRGEA